MEIINGILKYVEASDIVNGTFIIPEGVTEISYNAFYDFDIENIIFPKTLKIIGNIAFKGCIKLKEIKIPEGVTEIGYNAFFECFSLEKVILPKTLKIIGKGAFSYCNRLKEIKIPEGVTEIGYNAFLSALV